MSFVPYGSPIDLSNCDREPIHIPGQTQAHGVLFAVDRETLRILQVSDNVDAFLGRGAAEVLGAEILSLFGTFDFAAVSRTLHLDGVELSPVHVFCGMVAGKGPFDVIVHTDGPLVIVEIEPVQASDIDIPDFYTFASRTIANLRSRPTTREYCDALASAIRDLTGYDRVMIYRFAEDWSGHVWAESIAPGKGLAPFLDLHYPASDIPSQARALFLKNTIRMLVDSRYVPSRLVPELNPKTGAPLDMSQAFLRGASQMYTEYLINMGVSASLTMALSDRDRLWGLVACHHYDEKRHVSHGVRVVCELLARVASLQISDKIRNDEAEYRSRIQSAHTALVEAMAAGSDVGKTLAKQSGAVRSFVECTGIAVVYGGEVHTDGETPPIPHLRRLAGLLSGTAKGAVVATERLLTLYPAAESFKGVAAGMLALPLSSAPGEFVMWFRSELVRTVSWAGDPHKPVTVGPMGDRLTPRKSFELWTETVKGASAPWTRLEIDSAERLRTSFVELLARRHHELERLNRELERSNAELDSFAYVASHDLKEPLRGIYNYAAFLKRDARERFLDEDVEKVESVIRLVTRMRSLIDSLLEFSRMGRLEVRFTEVPLGSVVTGVVEALAPRIQERGARVRVASDLPTVIGVPQFFEQIFTNLLTNALKYNDKETLEVEIGFVRAGDEAFPERALGARYAFFVKDNGIGIPERHLEAVFQIFKRLHTQDKFGGGTGAGLTIVKKLIERLSGKIWIESQVAVGTTVWFAFPEESGGGDGS